ncbi:hypothetical protein [Grimontia hollisae]|nr:hypothetical protein [Grimontia hollisae]
MGCEYLRDETIPMCELMMDEINHDPEIASRRELQVVFDLGLLA